MSKYWSRHDHPALAPGWKMTLAQRASYWRMWAQVSRHMGWEGLPKEELHAHRVALHQRAGLGPCSAKDIDKLKGFDAIKAAFLACLQPDNLDAQLRQANMPLTRLITAIEARAPEAVRRAIMRDKYCGRTELSTLNETELTQLRNTLARWANNNKAGRASTPCAPSENPQSAIANPQSLEANCPF